MRGSLEIFILARNFQSRSKSRIFLIFGPSGIKSAYSGPGIAGVREQETMPLVNHAFARMTPAIFVIFVVLTGSEQESPCFTGQNANSSFSAFLSKPLFLAGDKGTVYQRHRFLDPEDEHFWNGVLGRGCDEAEISAEKPLFTEWGQGIQ